MYIVIIIIVRNTALLPSTSSVVLVVVVDRFYICNRVYCIHVSGHDPLTFSFLSFSFLIVWEFYGPNYLRC